MIQEIIQCMQRLLLTYHPKFWFSTHEQCNQSSSSVCKLTPAIYRAMYRYLSGDASANPNKVSKETDERLKLALTSGDPSIIYDLRELNLGRYRGFFYNSHQNHNSHMLQ